MNLWIGQFSSFLSTTQTKLQTVSLTLDQHMCEVKSINLLFFTNYTVTIFLAVFLQTLLQTRKSNPHHFIFAQHADKQP